MSGNTSWTTPEPPRPAIRTVPGCRLRTHDVPHLGRVVEVVLSGDPEFWQEVRYVLGEEIPRRTPHYLVLDLRGLDCIVGSAFLGGLVAGAVEMKCLGRFGGTRIVATGEMATRLDRSLALCKLQPVLGPLHDSVTSVLLGIARGLRRHQAA